MVQNGRYASYRNAFLFVFFRFSARFWDTDIFRSLCFTLFFAQILPTAKGKKTHIRVYHENIVSLDNRCLLCGMDSDPFEDLQKVLVHLKENHQEELFSVGSWKLVVHNVIQHLRQSSTWRTIFTCVTGVSKASGSVCISIWFWRAKCQFGRLTDFIQIW